MANFYLGYELDGRGGPKVHALRAQWLTRVPRVWTLGSSRPKLAYPCPCKVASLPLACLEPQGDFLLIDL